MKKKGQELDKVSKPSKKNQEILEKPTSIEVIESDVKRIISLRKQGHTYTDIAWKVYRSISGSQRDKVRQIIEQHAPQLSKANQAQDIVDLSVTAAMMGKEIVVHVLAELKEKLLTDPELMKEFLKNPGKVMQLMATAGIGLDSIRKLAPQEEGIETHETELNEEELNELIGEQDGRAY